MSTTRLPRRGFLASATVVGAAGVAGLVGQVMAAEPKSSRRRRRRPVRVNKMTQTHFEEMVGSKLQVSGSAKYGTDTGESGPVTLTVIKTASLPLSKADIRTDGRVRWVNGGNRIRNAPFCIVFRAPQGTELEQGTYDFRHPEMGKFSLFLAPISEHDGEDKEYEYFEVNFN